MARGKEDKEEVMTFAIWAKWMGKTKQLSAPIANVVGMT